MVIVLFPVQFPGFNHPQKTTETRGKKSLQKFIPSRNRAVKVQKQGSHENMQKDYPTTETVVEKKGMKTILHLLHTCEAGEG